MRFLYSAATPGGNHGGGAARVAAQRFGDVEGEGKGLFGQGYALPTMGGVGEVHQSAAAFIAFAKSRPDLTFYLHRCQPSPQVVSAGGIGILPVDASNLSPQCAQRRDGRQGFFAAQSGTKLRLAHIGEEQGRQRGRTHDEVTSMNVEFTGAARILELPSPASLVAPLYRGAGGQNYDNGRPFGCDVGDVIPTETSQQSIGPVFDAVGAQIEAACLDPPCGEWKQETQRPQADDDQRHAQPPSRLDRRRYASNGEHQSEDRHRHSSDTDSPIAARDDCGQIAVRALTQPHTLVVADALQPAEYEDEGEEPYGHNQDAKYGDGQRQLVAKQHDGDDPTDHEHGLGDRGNE